MSVVCVPASYWPQFLLERDQIWTHVFLKYLEVLFWNFRNFEFLPHFYQKKAFFKAQNRENTRFIFWYAMWPLKSNHSTCLSFLVQNMRIWPRKVVLTGLLVWALQNSASRRVCKNPFLHFYFIYINLNKLIIFWEKTLRIHLFNLEVFLMTI